MDNATSITPHIGTQQMHKRMRWRRVTVLSAHSYAPSYFRRFLLSSNGPFDLVATFLCPLRKRPKGARQDRVTHVKSNFRIELDFLVHLVMWWIFKCPESWLAMNWQLKSSKVVNVVTKHHIRRILRITCEANMELSIVGIWSGRQEKAVVVHYPQILPRKRRQNTRRNMPQSHRCMDLAIFLDQTYFMQSKCVIFDQGLHGTMNYSLWFPNITLKHVLMWRHLAFVIWCSTIFGAIQSLMVSIWQFSKDC